MKPNYSSPNKSSRKSALKAGFSMVELIVTIFVISALAGISVVAVGRIHTAAKSNKVESDVKNLNSAIKIYMANGGSLTPSMTPGQVLNKLKSSRNRDAKKLHVGAPSGRMIDVRTVAVPVASSGNALRARYDGATQQFILVTSGTGVEFKNDESLNEAFFGIEDRGLGTVNYAVTSKWIWDHASTVNPANPIGPNQVSVSDSPTDTNPPIPGGDDDDDDPPISGDDDDDPPPPDDDDPPPPTPPRLPTPYFSIRSGGYPDTQFPMSVSITNVPPTSNGNAIIRIGSGGWAPYTGAITIPTEPTSIWAQFTTADPESFRDSYTRSASYYPIATSISGHSSGTFHSPSGGPNMEYEITMAGAKFTHGNNEYDPGGGAPPIPIGDRNSVTVTQANFDGITPGTEFKLLDVVYHNGNSFYDSHATSVKLNLDLNFPSAGQSMDFDVNLSLVNTQNDPSDPNASADYIRLNSTYQNLGLTINGVSYNLSYRFHSLDNSGFNTNTQFHVYEGNTAQAEIRATLIANP